MRCIEQIPKSVELGLEMGSWQGLEEFEEHDERTLEFLEQAVSSKMDANIFASKGSKGTE